MYKRLAISLMLMGLAGFALAAGAFAWFSDSGSAGVEITAGTPDIIFNINQDCDGDVEATGVDDFPGTMTWTGVVPGEESNDCIRVINDGDGELDVYVDHQSVTGALSNHVYFRYWNYADGDPNDVTNRCGGVNGLATHANFTSANDGRGCFLGTLAEGQHLNFKVRALFQDNGSNQNTLQGESLDMTVVVAGYTG